MRICHEDNVSRLAVAQLRHQLMGNAAGGMEVLDAVFLHQLIARLQAAWISS